jgi:hypothetical protein
MVWYLYCSVILSTTIAVLQGGQLQFNCVDPLVIPHITHPMEARAERQKNMVMGLTRPETKHDCAGEGQQKFRGPILH